MSLISWMSLISLWRRKLVLISSKEIKIRSKRMKVIRRNRWDNLMKIQRWSRKKQNYRLCKLTSQLGLIRSVLNQPSSTWHSIIKKIASLKMISISRLQILLKINWKPYTNFK
jgi:hypothetical protein